MAAAAAVLMSEEKAQNLGLTPLAKVITTVSASVEPEFMGLGPAVAIPKALQMAGLTFDDIDYFEINEAFAAMPLVSTKILAEGDATKWRQLIEKTNVNGGAIAIGHPVGASAGRITMTLAYELRRRGGGYGIAAICGGLAQGEGVILRV